MKFFDLDARDKCAFEALCGDEANSIKKFLDIVPDALKAMMVRDTLARQSFAEGKVPRHMRDGMTAGMVPLSEVSAYAGAIPSDDANRIKIFGSLHKPIGKPAETLSTDFIEYVYDVSDADGRSAPMLRHRALVDEVDYAPGLLVAGGSVLNEVMLPESTRTEARVNSALGGVKTYQLKGQTTDVDNFIVIQHALDEELQKTDVLVSRAKRIAMTALIAVDPPRFRHSHDEDHDEGLMCRLCKGDIEADEDYVSCTTGLSKHVCHKECHEEWAEHRFTELRRGRCPLPGCGALMCDGSVRALVEATRSTVNVTLPGGKKPVWQLTSRVYRDWRQVLVGFDLAPSQIAFDGREAFVTEMCALALANGVLPVTPFVMSNTCEFRMIKYIMRYGFDLYVPGLTQAQYDAIKPMAVRGIAGVKWIVNKMEGSDVSLDVAWDWFCNEIKTVRAATIKFTNIMGLEMSNNMHAQYATPYTADNMHMNSLIVMEKDTPTTAAARPVDMVTLDMIKILRFHTVNPGVQAFFQAQFDRYQTARGDGSRRVISTITCFNLWHRPMRIALKCDDDDE